MSKFGFIVVEGPHDAEFVFQILKPFGLELIQMKDAVPRYFSRLADLTFPHKGNLLNRVPVPNFYASSTHAICVHSAQGDGNLIRTVRDNFATLEIDQLTGYAILMDADLDKAATAADRYAGLKAGLARHGHNISSNMGEVLLGPPRCGAYVLPDNSSSGTLEDILIECADHTYANLLSSARAHVGNVVNDTTLLEADLTQFKKPAGKNKAIVASVGNILRPGKTVQVTLHDNRWINSATLTIKKVQDVQSFLAKVLDLT